MKISKITVLSVLLIVLSACTTTSGTVAERRQLVHDMQTTVLNSLYQEKPDVKEQIRSAAGYGVFSNANINVIFASFGGGYGMVTDNSTGQQNYMKMGEVGVGFGAGIKDARVVMVFHTKEALENFIETGLTFGAQADATAVANNQGGAVGGEAVVNNVTIYPMTEAGLALQATIKGTKFWKDPDLN